MTTFLIGSLWACAILAVWHLGEIRRHLQTIISVMKERRNIEEQRRRDEIEKKEREEIERGHQ